MTADNQDIHTTPKQLQRTLTAMSFKGLVANETPELATMRWPQRPEGWFWVNVINTVFSVLVLMVSLLIIPTLYAGFKWVSKVVKRRKKEGDWFDRAAHSVHLDLLYQCMARLSSSRLADTTGIYKDLKSNNKSNNHEAQTHDSATLKWFWQQTRGEVTLALEASQQRVQTKAWTSKLSVTLNKPGGQPLIIPAGWLGSSTIKAQRLSDSAVELAYTGPLEAQVAAISGRRTEEEDATSAMADALGTLLEANGLRSEQSPQGDRSRHEEASLNPGPCEDPDLPQRAEVLRDPLHQPGLGSALWGLKGWLASTFLKNLGFTALVFGFMGGIFTLGPLLNPDPVPAGMIALSAVIVLGLVLTFGYMVDTHLPRPARRKVRTQSDGAQLSWANGVLALGESRVRLDKPFAMNLSRGLEGHPARCWLNVDLRQRTAEGLGERLRFRVRIDSKDGVDALPRLDTASPRIAAADFEGWIWPLIEHFNTLHGTPLASQHQSPVTAEVSVES